LTFGVCCDNLGDKILNKFNSVENKLKEHLPLSFVHMELKGLSAENFGRTYF